MHGANSEQAKQVQLEQLTKHDVPVIQTQQLDQQEDFILNHHHNKTQLELAPSSNTL